MLRRTVARSTAVLLQTRRRGFHSIPVVDLDAVVHEQEEPDERTSRKLFDAFHTTGFCCITGHGVSPWLIDDMLVQSNAMFDLHEDAKNEFAISKSKTYRGYQGFGTNVTKGKQDRHEGFDIMRELPVTHPLVANKTCKLVGKNQWPDENALPHFRYTYTEYVRAMNKLGRTIMTSLAVGLNLPKNAFDAYYSDPFWLMRAIRYPPVEASPVESKELGEHGCGEHTDYGCLTIIAQNDVPGCLQVKNTAGEWITADPVQDGLMINIGDMVEVWTGGILRATPHRVLAPMRDHTSTARISVPFFFEPNYDAVIAPLEGLSSQDSTYEPVMYGDHLFNKCSSNFVG